MTPQPQIPTFREVLALPGVRRLLIGQLVSIAGDFLALIAVMSIASFRLHATPAQITGVTISYMLPLALFGPLAGVFVDRFNPRLTMIASDLARACLAFLLIYSTRLSEIYALLFAISTVSTFFNPAQSVLLRTLVSREALLPANAMMQQAMLVIRIASPALAGALVAHFGPASCFGLDTVSFLFSALVTQTLVCLPRVRQPLGCRAIAADLTAGIRFILTHPNISFVIAAMAAATFAISCFNPLMAIFVRDILHQNVQLFGLISAMTGIGMIAGTQTVRKMAKRYAPSQIVRASLGVIATGILVIGVSQTALVTAAGAVVMGAGVGLLTVPAQTLIQSETPVAMLGRVSSAVTSLIATAQILGLTLSGQLAAQIGLRPLFLLSAAVLLATLWDRPSLLVACRSASTQTNAEQTH